MKPYLPIVFLCLLLSACSTSSTEFSVPEGGYQRIAVTSSTHVGFLSALGSTDRIVGICDPQYVYQPMPDVLDLGSSIQLDPERIYASGAEVVLLTNATTDENALRVLRQLGVEPIVVEEWKESDLLARASWIRFFGLLVDKRHEADSVYASVCEAYHQTEAQCRDKANVEIMSGGAWNGTWYVPGGQTYMAKLFHDAGASYYYASDSTTASLPLTFEQALVAFREAQVWVGAPANTLSELLEMNDHYSWFAAYQNGRVYSFDKRTLPSGANDFWETGVVHPELILSDLYHILRSDPDSLLYFSLHLQ